MKATLVAADKEGIPIRAAIHDEFLFSFYDIKQAKRLKELQLDTVKLSVPMQVDLEIGPSWGEVQKLEGGEGIVKAFEALMRRAA